MSLAILLLSLNMLARQQDCRQNFTPLEFDGVIVSIKRDSPYPFERCEGTVWKCKVRFEWWEMEEDGTWEKYVYKSYPVGDGMQCFDASGRPYDCCLSKKGTRAHVEVRYRPNSPLRGEIVRMEAE